MVPFVFISECEPMSIHKPTVKVSARVSVCGCASVTTVSPFGEGGLASCMRTRACLRRSARLPFSLHARSVERKRKYCRIASTSRYGDLPFLRLCPPLFRNVKFCKLYLYSNEHTLALSQHTIHIRRFSDFSRGWGIGEEAFEFWSWIARQ